MPDRHAPTIETDVLVLGAGPAALATALALHRSGVAVALIGQTTATSAWEGASPRLVQALQQWGCHQALDTLSPAAPRQVAWAGQARLANAEHLLDRAVLHAAWWQDLTEQGVAMHAGRVIEVVPPGAANADAPHPWHVHWHDGQGELRQARAHIVVDGRGASASATPLWQGPVTLTLSRAVQAPAGGAPRCFAVSLPDGWAWGHVDARGHGLMQCFADPGTVPERDDWPAWHERQRQQVWAQAGLTLPHASGDGPVLARAWRGRWCAPLSHPRGFRVGEACLAADPLSGHGMFDAFAMALACAPAVRTVLHRPADAELARRFYEDRVAAMARARREAAHGFYATAAASHPGAYWARRVEATAPATAAPSPPPAMGWQPQPVVEHGWILPRRVLVTPQHPGGIRLLDGIDLADLRDRLGPWPGDAGPSPAQAAQLASLARTHAQPVPVWLRAWRLTGQADAT